MKEFSLRARVLCFDKDPIRRLLLVERPSPYHQTINDKIPIYVPFSCKLEGRNINNRDIEHGKTILIEGYMISYMKRKTLIIQLMAEEISEARDELDEVREAGE